MHRFGGYISRGSPSIRIFSRTSQLQQKRFNASQVIPAPKSYTKSKILVGLGLLGIGAYYTNDSFHAKVRHVSLTGERVGVVTIATIRCFNLYRKTLSKEYGSEEERALELSRCHKKAAEITLGALQTNGGIYIKFGQHISAMTYLFPKEWTETMVPLQSECPESSLEDIKQMFIKDLGLDLDDVFVEFDPKPIGVASLAQVHIARLRSTGEKVAVKVQHPSLQEFVPVDVYMTKAVFDLMFKVFPEYPLTWLGDELQSSIFVELDFTKEAENALKTSRYFKKYEKETALRIPEVYSAYPRILVMEYVSGVRLDDIKYLSENNISRSEVSCCLSHIFNNMIFTPDVSIHCDPHGGNLAIRKSSDSTKKHNFEIILYDHGLYRDVPMNMRRDYANFWLAMLDQDHERMRRYAKNFAGIEGKDFEIFSAAVTGRDFNHALNDVTSTRTDKEMEVMTEALTSGGLFFDLMILLSKLPRVVLLILKTNDLTRNLDEGLQNPLGPERTFLILATYCAKTVYDADLESINQKYSKWSLSWIMGEISSWFKYRKRVNELYMYDCLMWVKNFRKSITGIL